MLKRAAATTTLEQVDVECTFCHVTMTSHVGSGNHVRYFHCGACHRWVSSSYTEVFRADAKLRTRRREEGLVSSGLSEVQSKLKQFWAALDSESPYRLLGVTSADPMDKITERFRELSRQHHPNNGGDLDDLRRLNSAFEAIARQREKAERATLAAGRLAAGTL